MIEIKLTRSIRGLHYYVVSMNCFRTVREILKSLKAHRDVQLSWCGNFAETHSFYSFWRFARRFPHQEIRCLYSISCKVFCNFFTLTLRKIPLFHLTSWCGSFVERHNFRIVSGESPVTVLKLCLSTKFSHQEIGKITTFHAVQLGEIVAFKYPCLGNTFKITGHVPSTTRLMVAGLIWYNITRLTWEPPVTRYLKVSLDVSVGPFDLRLVDRNLTRIGIQQTTYFFKLKSC